MNPRTLLTITLAAILGACSAQDDGKSTAPTTQAQKPAPQPEETAPATTTQVAIASVQMQEDCPDPKPASPPVPAKQALPARPSSMAPSDSAAGYVQPCVQSTLQLSFTGQGDSASAVSIKELRLLSADEKALGTIETRLPTQWHDNGYQPWDQQLEPKTDLKAAYKISPPDWSAVEALLGGTSYGAMFVLELVVEIDGVSQTVRSAQFVRQQPVAIPT